MAEYEVIGSRPVPYGAVEKLTGQAVFGADVRLPQMIHGRVLRSPHAHARIHRIDTTAAEALPGVRAVATAADFTAGNGWENMLAGSKALYVGHPIAAVAADDTWIAEEALGLIRVDYEPLPPVLDMRAALQPGAPLLHPDLEAGNVASHFEMVKGDPDRALREAAVMVEREFRTTMVHQGYIEPHASLAAWSPDGSLTIWTCTQGAFPVRSEVARLLGLPESRVRVVPTAIGGGFGGKTVSYLDAVAAILARKAALPVKMVMSRAEVLQATGPTPGTIIRIKAAAGPDGRLQAVIAELYYEAGAFPSSIAGSGAEVLLGGYDVPHARIEGYDVVVNKPHTASYRAPGACPAAFAMEQVADELAGRLRMDPIEFRLLNAAREGTVRVNGSSAPVMGTVEVLHRAREHPHYRAPLGGPNRGRGVACGYWGNWGAQSSCTIQVNSDGTVSLLTGSVDLSGSLTSIAMQAAEMLGVPIDRVQASVGDTGSIGFTEVTAGSRTTFASGLAAVEAARDVIAQLRARAAELWRAPLEQVTFERGVLSYPAGGRKMTFTELAGLLLETGGPVTGRGNVDGDRYGVGPGYGAHIADVEVDPETGRVRVLRYTAVQDVGRAIHPGNVEGQIQGGVVQGIGWALYEGYQYGPDGAMLNPTLLDYKLPTALDAPPIEPVIVEVPCPTHPFGVRGAGEVPIVPAPAAVANAIYHATGVRMEQLPMSPAYILERMGII